MIPHEQMKYIFFIDQFGQHWYENGKEKGGKSLMYSSFMGTGFYCQGLITLTFS